jgi:hypothetical protein
LKGIVKNNIKLPYMSEENCANCSNAFDTEWLVTKCPDCGEKVVSCNACDNERCGDCDMGNKFRLYGTKEDKVESKRGIRFKQLKQ